MRLSRREWIPDPAISVQAQTTLSIYRANSTPASRLASRGDTTKNIPRGPEKPGAISLLRRPSRTAFKRNPSDCSATNCRRSRRRITMQSSSKKSCSRTPKRPSQSAGPPTSPGRGIFGLDRCATPVPGRPGYGTQSSHGSPNSHRGVGRNRRGGNPADVVEDSETQIG